MADEPVSGEPVSEARFPANREKNREFFDFGPFSRATVLKVVCNSGGYERIPYAAEQGNNSLDLGIVFPGTGNNYKAGPAETRRFPRRWLGSTGATAPERCPPLDPPGILVL